MPTLAEIAKEMLVRCPGDDAIGRLAAISSLTATTVVSSALAFGGNSEQRYSQKWLWRITTTTTADKVRFSDSFAPATGTLTHSGTNYTDTTATGEEVIISNFDPYLIREAIDLTVRSLRRLDKTEYPSTKGQRKFWVNDEWIRHPSDIAEVGYSQSPVLSKDRYFDKWGEVGTDGSLQLTHWALSGSGATVARSTAKYWRGSHVVALTRSSSDCEIVQTIPVYRNGVDGYDLRGKSVTFLAWALCGTASRFAARIDDQTGSNSASETHTGGGTWEELTGQITVDNNSESLTLELQIEDGDVTAYIGEAFLVETEHLSDAVRFDTYQEHVLPDGSYRFDQWGTLQVNTQEQFNQLLVWSKRPYPGFDSTRLTSGAADADSTDAPKEIVATGAIARLFRGRADSEYAMPNDVRRAEEWEAKFADMARRHQALPQKDLTSKFRTNGGLVPAPRRL